MTQIIPAKSFDFSLNQQDLSEERVLGLLGLPTVGFGIKMVEKSSFWEESASSLYCCPLSLKSIHSVTYSGQNPSSTG